MKKIPLSQGLFASVDDSCFDELSKYKWHAKKSRSTWYVARYVGKESGKELRITMHQQLLPSHELVDHRDGDGLNNQLHNLREATKQQNQQNRVSRVGASKYKGVSWSKSHRKWLAYIGTNADELTAAGTKRRYLGYFSEESAAAKAYDAAAHLLFGEFAKLNFTEGAPHVHGC